MQQFIDRAAATVEAMRTARSRRGFLEALTTLQRMLSLVPEYPATFFTDAGYQRLIPVVDRAVEQVEGRLEARTDSASVQRQLAAAIYRLRKESAAIFLRIRNDPAPGASPAGVAADLPPGK